MAQPTALDVLDKLTTRHKTYDRVPSVTKKTKRGKKKAEDDDDSSVPVSLYRTTSTEAMDTEEGQEITRYIKEEAQQRQQKALSVHLFRMEGPIYDVPQSLSIPIPESHRDWSRSFEKSTTERAKTPIVLYEDLGTRTTSAAQTPKYFDRTAETMDTIKKAPVPSEQSAFVSYREAVLGALDRQTHEPQVDRGELCQKHTSLPWFMG